MKPVLSVLEGKWFQDRHVSIRDLFSPLFGVWTSNGEASYHYEQFTNTSAFRAAIRYAFGTNRASTIYIGAHGDYDKIHGFHDEGISRRIVRNALNFERGTTKRGVYFGACSFIHKDNAGFILEACRRVEWVAGYETEVDWIDSSVIDLCFLRHYLFPTPGKGSRMPSTARQRLTYATKRIQADMNPLAERLRFHVFLRRPGPRPGIEDLMSRAAI